MKGGFIVLHRKLETWEWAHDPWMIGIWVKLILRANWKPAKFKTTTIDRGQFISTVKNLAEHLDISPQRLRTAISKLEKTGNLTRVPTNQFTLYTIENYSYYQDEKEWLTNQTKTSNKRITNEQQTINKRSTRIEQRNKETRKTKEQSIGDFDPDDVPDFGGNGKTPPFLKVFDYYRQQIGKSDRYVLDAKRKKMINQALKVRGVDDLMRAVDNFRADIDHPDPNFDRSKFDDLKYLFGDQERIDKWCDRVPTNRAFHKAKAEYVQHKDKTEVILEMMEHKEREKGDAN